MPRLKLLHTLFLHHPLICTDTRKVQKGCIFFALKGPNFNGNSFAQQALNEGASFAVIDEAEFLNDDRCLLVDNVLKRLQELARYHRQQMKIPVIAIVGSNGKTTTKELLTSVLTQKYKVWSTPGNLNNHIGVPLTLLQLKPEHEVAIIEMGANHVGENAELCEIAQPTLGIITNNGMDHLEGFGSLEGVIQSNRELYDYLLQHNGHAFVNANDEALVQMATNLKHKTTYAGNCDEQKTSADIEGVADQVRPEIKFHLAQEELNIHSHLSGDYNFDNIMAAVSIGLHLGLTSGQIKAGIENYIPENNRSQVIKTNSNTLFMDAYNANPSSMEAALRNFAAMPFPKKIAVLGDMFELGEYASGEHKRMIGLANQLGLEKVVFVGEEFAKQANPDDIAFRTTNEALAYFKQNPLMDATVFLKGSRGMKLEQLAEVF
ncbi:MAG: UDP-N-acetylmuramoyl-tripeptide--D-alanyl-D-alanine ligase [Bacteroidia bacterium]|jgi:UDP-N-acetylmuramoyl-tripeptide--D-alanyl-D-alanine ligase